MLEVVDAFKLTSGAKLGMTPLWSEDVLAINGHTSANNLVLPFSTLFTTSMPRILLGQYRLILSKSNEQSQDLKRSETSTHVERCADRTGSLCAQEGCVNLIPGASCFLSLYSEKKTWWRWMQTEISRFGL